jgi:hypothetical protein
MITFVSKKKKKVMNAYKFNTRVSDAGTITLPFDARLSNTDVEVFIVPINRNSTEKSSFSASDFISKWRGCVKGMENVSDKDLDRIKQEYLKQKHA